MTRRKAAASSSPFRLPPGVSVSTSLLASGKVYVFRHEQLGELGRLCLLGTPGGQTQILAEVSGDPADPMTAQRQAILEPLTTVLISLLEQQLGQGVSVQVVPSPPSPPEQVATQLAECEHCGAGVALLVRAEDTGLPGYLEDCARLMYATIARLNVPTWVIGPIVETGRRAGTFDALKVWPAREAARTMHSDDLQSQLAALEQGHCPR